MEHSDDVYGLITKLCNRTAQKHCSHNQIPFNKRVARMKSRAYEILLKKAPDVVSCSKREPIMEMLSLYLSLKQNVKNVAEYKRAEDLKAMVKTIRTMDEQFTNGTKESFDDVIKLLVALKDSYQPDYAVELFQSPFSFGLLDKMLPKPSLEPFGSPQPYSFYPPHVFDLPFSLRRQEAKLINNGGSLSYCAYTVESFDSASFSINNNCGKQDLVVKTFLSPMSVASLDSSVLFPSTYSSTSWDCPRLTEPRDLKIPRSEASFKELIELKCIESSSNAEEMNEVFHRKQTNRTVDIWEIATNMDKDVPNDIWEVASKMPESWERQLIATSLREMMLWRRIYGNSIHNLSVTSEKLFIRHIMYLIIGVETSTFRINHDTNSFYMNEAVILEGVSKELIRGYVTELLLVGTYYRRLYMFAFNQTVEDHFHSNGFVYEAAREVIRRYLLQFRLVSMEIYKECTTAGNEGINCMPTLLQILYHMEPLRYEIENIVTIYKLFDPESQTSLPRGAELMSYLFNEISLITHTNTAFTMYNSLLSICKVYFKFIERFIFEGELDDRFDEFFIRKDSQYVNARSKRYWDKGFHISQSAAVPEFVRSLAKFILLCGKSLRLLRLCNPSDPLVILISSDHPSVTCCTSFEELERQQEALDVYRTRCLFVSGEPVTFDQILLKREAERKAFTEMASLKQAETLEKIVAERKRLAQLIIAEKQHSLRVLEAAMAEAKAAKQRAKDRERRRFQMQEKVEKAAEEVDSRIREDERTKMMEYYSKLNMEVEKSKLHTEWKIKRLQLDESRMQLLSTEERNLKREKMEKEHQRAEEMMAMSFQSLDRKSDELDTKKVSSEDIFEEARSHHSNDSRINTSNVINVLCNAAKSIFGVPIITRNCDNTKELDAQGNEVAIDKENNFSDQQYKTSSDVIGGHLNNALDNIEYLKTIGDAFKIKQKVMNNEFGHTNATDDQNNYQLSMVQFIEAKQNKLKVLGAECEENPFVKRSVSEPRTVAQEEAIRNKRRVLGVEFNLPMEPTVKKEPANTAQEAAIRNKEKILGSEDMMEGRNKTEPTKRPTLTLDLKSCCATSETSLGITPSTGAVTPGDMFSRLDLETPTTSDRPLSGPMSNDALTPYGDDDGLDSEAEHKKYGFNFSLIEDEVICSEASTENSSSVTNNTPKSSQSRNFEDETLSKKSYINFIDGSYCVEGLDAFGVKSLNVFSKNYFNHKMNSLNDSSYTHPSVIMEAVKKPPSWNIFAKHFGPDKGDQEVTCDSIATLTACLQRSVMLPLTYQLEVVNNSILTYFLVNLDMYDHLKSMKDYFFLMDGEFSNSICQNLFSKLVKTLNPQELLNFATLHSILDRALGCSISHNHKYSENLSFTISEVPVSFQHSSPDVLQCLSLTYSVSWPLNILLSHESLLRYAKVFQFLVKMRRIFWILGEDFKLLKVIAKASNQYRKILKSPQYISVQVFRHVMASMVRALDNYIVTTCIHTTWSEFELDLKKAKTLDDLYVCHVTYIKQVIFRCLLNNRSTPIMKLLNDIFTVILKFSRLLKAGEWQQKEPNGYFTHTSYRQLEELFYLFKKLAKYLHKVVTRLMECGYQRHLAELLTMVNFNGYYNSVECKPKNESTNDLQSP